MPTLRLALAQVDPTVGDLAGNAALVRDWTRRAAEAGAQLVAFPELMLTGYPVEDLVFRQSFVAASRSALTDLAADLAGQGMGELAVVVGYLDADGHATSGASATVPPSEAASRTDAPAGVVGGPGWPLDNAPAPRNADARSVVGPRNAAAVLHSGQVVGRYYKHHLPNYGVFDEDRYFVPGDTLTVFRAGGVDIALTICEDLWQAGGPFAVARQAAVGLVVNINGSPYELNKDDVRLPLVARRAAEAGATVAYVNMVGGQDELVFDGDSVIVAPDGAVLARAPLFAEYLLVHDVELPAAASGAAGPVVGAETAPDAARGVSGPGDEPGELRVARLALPGDLPARSGQAAAQPVASAPAPGLAPVPDQATIGGVAPERLATEAEVWQALVLSLRDYTHKNGFESVVVALSGGIDSSVVAAISADALGPANVVGVSMPSQHSSAHSRDDAAELAERIGLDYRVEQIQPMVDAFLANLSLSGVAVENLQARVRGMVLMSLSNQEGQLALTTGNKSELAVGYSTLYGDSVGGFNPLKDVPKTLVWRLAEWRNQAAAERGEPAPIPERVISKPPSAELRPGQLDTDSLPPYLELDAILADYVDGDLGRDGLVEVGHDPATVDRVLRMVDRAEYKRRQSAPGTKISIKAFGRDRRLPITNRFRER